MAKCYVQVLLFTHASISRVTVTKDQDTVPRIFIVCQVLILSRLCLSSRQSQAYIRHMAGTLYNQAMNNQSKLSNIWSSIPPLAADAWLSTRWFYHNDPRIIRPGNIRFISADSFFHTISITFNKNAKEKKFSNYRTQLTLSSNCRTHKNPKQGTQSYHQIFTIL